MGCCYHRFRASLPSFMITWALIPGLYTMGVSMGNKALISAAFWLTNPWADVAGLDSFSLSALSPSH